MEEIVGYVDSVVYSNEENGFTVARLKEPKKTDTTTIVGVIPTLTPGESIRCQGNWKHHASHGMQFDVVSFTTKTPSDAMGIQKYLESGLIKGIGIHFAKKIIAHFGTDTLDIIDQRPEALLEIEGIGEKRVEKIKSSWDAQRSIRNVMIFLHSHNIRPSFAQKIYKLYGEQTIEKIKENPYNLAKHIFGIGFKSADDIAQKIGIDHNSPIRIQAGITHLLWELSTEGHVCFPEKDLGVEGKKILDVEPEEINNQLQTLEEDSIIVREKLEKDGVSETYVWVKPLFFSEMGIARELNRLTLEGSTLLDINIEESITWAEQTLYIRLAPEQKKAIAISLEEKIHIITGGPGTGKSTITKAILKIFEKCTDKIILAAPTGRAAKRMSEITQKNASTIHSLLEMDFTNGGFKKNKENPIDCDLIIIDEASMIDSRLMNHLLKAIPDHSRAIFIGDIDQLPSVGAGNVLQDIIESNRIPVTRLTQIFRQAANSKIIRSAHSINKGFFPNLEIDPTSDFFFLETQEPEQILQKAVDLIANKLPAKYGLHSIDDIQMLSPMKKGVVGCENANLTLQNALNPSSSPLIKMGKIFHIGDKVMQIRNNYQKIVFNGDVGRIKDINREDQEICVIFDNKEVFYDFSEMDELMLAYCVSVHKYQGSECPCIIMPVHTCHFKLLFRNLLYTGITRGKKLVVLLGTKKALAIAIKNNEVKKRHTGLKPILQEMILETAN